MKIHYVEMSLSIELEGHEDIYDYLNKVILDIVDIRSGEIMGIETRSLPL